MRPMMPRDLVLGRACSSHVKVMLLHVLGCVDLHASVSWSKLVTNTSYDRICTFNVSVVRINGNMRRVGAPTQSP